MIRAKENMLYEDLYYNWLFKRINYSGNHHDFLKENDSIFSNDGLYNINVNLKGLYRIYEKYSFTFQFQPKDELRDRDKDMNYLMEYFEPIFRKHKINCVTFLYKGVILKKYGFF